MRRRAAQMQSTDGTGPRGRWARWREDLTMVVMFSLGGVLASMPYPQLQSRSVPWQLAYGAANYVVAVVAALLIGVVVARLPWPALRLVLGWGLVGLLVWPPVFGSATIAAAIDQLAGARPSGADEMLGACLGLLLTIPLVLLAWRTARRTGQPT